MLPPRIVRRLVCTPLLFILTFLVVVLFPVAYAVAYLAGRERKRALRLLWFTFTWGTRETAAVLECGWLWLRGRAHDDRNYDIIGRYVGALYASAQRRLGLDVEVDGTWDGSGGDRPLIVLSRHAGPGDALLIVHHLLSEYRRRPRVVMKAMLQLDPCIDIVANRVPNVFVTPGGAAGAVGRLAEGLAGREALLIFPEGGNFSPERRRRAIRRLSRMKRAEEATRAAAMRNVMPPRPGGVLAALESAPSADVVFVAHCGLDHMATAGDIWRRVPLTGPVRARWWRVPAEDIPGDRDARVRWLYENWERADAWISAQRIPAPK
ncbi:1-acyl-sn-glycerol-3-phosphate acyltransferase [Spirillospora sp. NPDC049024]